MGTYNFSKNIKDYKLINLIGVGSFGRVYKAKCNVVDDGESKEINCAVKCISKKSSPNFGKIYTEVSIHMRLNHPNILQLFNVIEDQENVYLILELCSCGTLAHYLKQKAESNKSKFNKCENKGEDKYKEPVLSYQSIRRIIRQVCSGLDYLHRNSIVHRDLNLNNLLIAKMTNEDDMLIKIADFGLAIDLNSSKQQINNTMLKPHRDKHVIPMPAGTTICGTPGFISPEVWSQMQTVSPASDIFSLGSILFSLISGYTPKGELDLSKYYPLATDIIAKLLAPNPMERPSISNVLRHPFILGPIDTQRLQPINKLTQLIDLSINNNGEVRLIFLKNQQTLEVSKDGQLITVTNSNKQVNTYSFDKLASLHWKKYYYAHKFVDLVKAKTAKVTLHFQNNVISENKQISKVCLMESGDLEISIVDTANNNYEKISADEHFSNFNSNLVKHVSDLKNRCKQIENQLMKISRLCGFECFPVSIGQRFVHKKPDIITSINPSTFSTTLRSVNINGIGVASQLSNGIIQVTFTDGSTLSLGCDSQIRYLTHDGEEKL